MKFDVVILGAGLGGLLCGAILAKEGYSVAIIEQHKQIGGCLQSFSFGKKLFDSCVHYIGGLSEGDNLYQIFKYAEVLDQLELEQLNKDAFDKIIIGDNDIQYPFAQGYEHFISSLSMYFPSQHTNLVRFCDYIIEVIGKFPLYHLENGDPTEKIPYLDISISDVLDRYFDDNLLKSVLVGNSLLYAGRRTVTPFYIYALVMNSYISGSYKIKGSSARIAKALWKTIRNYGGVIFKNQQVSAIVPLEDQTYSIQTEQGMQLHAAKCISNIHPKQTFSLFEKHLFRKKYIDRINHLPNTISALMINMIVKPGVVPYSHSNIYWNAINGLDVIENMDIDTPNNYALYFSQDAQNPGYADTLSVLCYMKMEAFEQYCNTRNVTNNPSVRSDSYETYKISIVQPLLQLLECHHPVISNAILDYKIATPLTFRDYMGTSDGSIYGIEKNTQNIMATQIGVNTKMPNFYWTGQNINLHGVVGTSITSLATCANFIPLDDLLARIKHA